MPEYYVFATNVVLTPVGDVGGKDRLLNYLQDWAKMHGLLGFAIWDYDQLCAYLDINEEIRKTFCAWITPGDVLAKLLEEIPIAGPDFASVASQYLQKEAWRDQYARLEQAGHPQDERIPLANVFVDLPIASCEDGEIDRDDFQGFFVEKLLEASGNPITISASDERAAETRRWVLIGGPGQGKTTVGQFACQLFRSALLGDPGISLEPEVASIVASVRDSATALKLQVSGRRFPIRIVLSEFAQQLSASAMSVMSYVCELFQRRTDTVVSTQILKGLLHNYPSIIVFDGLDEVPSSSNRDDVLAAIKDFEVDVRAHDLDCFILVTTRPQGFNNDLSDKYYEHKVLVNLNRDSAIRYGDRLTEVRFGTDPERVAKVKTRLRTASNNESTVRLMMSPLQITIMVLLVDQQGHPPEERWELFSQYYQLICKREIERDIPSSRVLRVHQPHIDAIHRAIGLLLHSRSDSRGSTNSRLKLEEFREVVRKQLVQEEFEGERLVSLIREIEEAATHRLVFLVGLEEGEVGFEIRSLQEFMAGEALIEGADNLIEPRLYSISKNPNWLNVLLFAAGKCFRDKQHLRQVFVSLCLTLNEDPNDEACVKTLSGSTLALNLLQDGAPRNSPKFSRQLMRLAVRLLDRKQRGIAISLSDVCTEDTTELLIEELALRDGYQGALKEEVDLCKAGLVDRSFDAAIREYGISVFEGMPQISLGGFWKLADGIKHRSDLLDAIADELIRRDPTPLLEYGYRPNRGGLIYARPDLWPELIRQFSDEGRTRRDEIQVKESYLGIELGVARVSRGHFEPIEIDIPTHAHPVYHFLGAVRRFETDPGPDQLANVIESTIGHDSRSWTRLVRSWILSAALRSSSSDESRREYSRKVRAGHLGDLEEWRASEESWSRAGINLSEEVGRIEFESPDKTPDRLSILFAQHTSYAPRAQLDKAQFIKIHRILAELDDFPPQVRRSVVQMLFVSTFWIPAVGTRVPDIDVVALEPPTLEAALRCCRKLVSLDTALSTAMIEFVHKLSAQVDLSNNEEFIMAVDQIYSNPEVWTMHPNPPINRSKIRTLLYSQVIEGLGLLRMLALDAAYSNAFEPFQVEDIGARFKGIRDIDLLVIGCRTGKLPRDTIEQIVELVDSDDLGALESVFSALALGDGDIEKTILNVLNRISRDNDLYMWLVSELSSAIASRRAPFTKESDWIEVGLNYPT